VTWTICPTPFAAITCTHAVSRERPLGLTLTAAVLAADVQDVDWLASSVVAALRIIPSKGAFGSRRWSSRRAEPAKRKGTRRSPWLDSVATRALVVGLVGEQWIPLLRRQ